MGFDILTRQLPADALSLSNHASMRRHVLAVILVCLATPAAFAALEWRKDTISIDAAPLDEKAEAVFEFTNPGPSAITITEVTTSCGCTVATPDKRTYARGEHGEIRAVFTFRGSVGKQSRTINVTTDEGGGHDYTLTIEANIPQLFDVSPYFVVWKRGDAPESKPITIRALRPDVILPVSAESRDARFTATLEKAPDAPDTYRVLIAPRDTEEAMNASIVVKTNFPAKDPQVINIYGLVR
jgi:hypothetical protein